MRKKFSKFNFTKINYFFQPKIVLQNLIQCQWMIKGCTIGMKKVENIKRYEKLVKSIIL